MAADQERNRKIAKALGWYEEDVCDTCPTDYMDTPTTHYWTEPAYPGSCGITRYKEPPDFSKPEWQIKIQEKVRELWCDGETRWIECRIFASGICDYVVNLTTKLNSGQRGRQFSSNVEIEVWEDALLWLAERKVKHD